MEMLKKNEFERSFLELENELKNDRQSSLDCASRLPNQKDLDLRNEVPNQTDLNSTNGISSQNEDLLQLSDGTQTHKGVTLSTNTVPFGSRVGEKALTKTQKRNRRKTLARINRIQFASSSAITSSNILGVKRTLMEPSTTLPTAMALPENRLLEQCPLSSSNQHAKTLREEYSSTSFNQYAKRLREECPQTSFRQHAKRQQEECSPTSFNQHTKRLQEEYSSTSVNQHTKRLREECPPTSFNQHAKRQQEECYPTPFNQHTKRLQEYPSTSFNQHAKRQQEECSPMSFNQHAKRQQEECSPTSFNQHTKRQQEECLPTSFNQHTKRLREECPPTSFNQHAKRLREECPPTSFNQHAKRLAEECPSTSYKQVDLRTKMAIVKQDFPKGKLSEVEEKFIQREIIKSIDDLPFDAPLPYISFSVLRNGAYVVYCDDAYTVKWLTSTFHLNDKVINGINLKVVKASQLAKPVTVSFKHKDIYTTDPQVLLKRLNRFNPRLNTGNWRVLQKDVGSQFARWIFQVDLEAVQEIREANFVGYAGLNRGIFKILSKHLKTTVADVTTTPLTDSVSSTVTPDPQIWLENTPDYLPSENWRTTVSNVQAPIGQNQSIQAPSEQYQSLQAPIERYESHQSLQAPIQRCESHQSLQGPIQRYESHESLQAPIERCESHQSLQAPIERCESHQSLQTAIEQLHSLFRTTIEQVQWKNGNGLNVMRRK